MQAEHNHHTKGLLRLTMACNERCPFCNVPVEDYERPTPADAEIDAQLDAFVAAQAQTLTLSGGEPTLLKRRLLRVISEAKRRGIPFIELQSNAILIDTDYAEALAQAGLGSAFISLLSDVPALHDRLAGLEGAWERCLRGIDALLAAGIRVTLNPVTALETQERLPDYIEFVASRFPQIRSISLSVVQPHGRAAGQYDLLPNYAILGPAVREARARAVLYGIELLNPYCGLPACVGWSDALAQSVEALEARDVAASATGLQNSGNKRHGPPCTHCVLRARCGGAWFAYWDQYGASGLQAPAQLKGPWVGVSEWEAVVLAPGGPKPESLIALAMAEKPFVWLWTDQLSVRMADALLSQSFGGLALELPGSAIRQAAALKGMYHFLLKRRQGLPQRQAALWLGLRQPGVLEAQQAAGLASVLKIDVLYLLLSQTAGWEPMCAVLSAQYGVEIRLFQLHA